MRNEAESYESETRLWATILHLSMLAGLAVPYAGYVAPIVIWLVKRDDVPEIDAHGKNAINWMISALLYGLAGVVLFVTVVGIPAAFVLWALLAVCGITFPIVGAIKANDGQIWRYPASLRFLS